jgi:hypothetical protein
MPGPVPKRSDERIRRNKVDIEKVTAIGKVPVPDLGLADAHPMVRSMYRAMRESAQSKYFEPSDWEFARFTMYFVDNLLKQGKPSSLLLQQVNSMLSSLLVTEGDRRRVRMEVERDHSGGDVIDVAEMFRQRLAR